MLQILNEFAPFTHMGITDFYETKYVACVEYLNNFTFTRSTRKSEITI